MKKLIVLFFMFFAAQTFAQGAQESVSVFSKKQKIDHDGTELYSLNIEMKNYKKFGFGLNLGSSTGILGLNGEVNLDGNDALAIGLGMGSSYGAFSLAWKHNFEAMYLSPYSKVGYSKWFSSSGKSANDSDVLKRIYSENDLRTGRFGPDFLIGGFGLEYNQLDGDMAGVNFFGEVIMMAEVSTSTFIPNGGIGIIYYY